MPPDERTPPGGNRRGQQIGLLGDGGATRSTSNHSSHQDSGPPLIVDGGKVIPLSQAWNQPEPRGPAVAAEAALRRIAELRQLLALDDDTRRHWHGGPDPCPICGGIRPELRS